MQRPSQFERVFSITGGCTAVVAGDILNRRGSWSHQGAEIPPRQLAAVGNRFPCFLTMEDPNVNESGLEPPKQGRPTALLLLTVLLATAGTAVAFLMWQTSARREARRNDQTSGQENARPAVNYVGDSACVRCHAEIAETYSRHPMGRSLATIGNAPRSEADPANEPAVSRSTD